MRAVICDVCGRAMKEGEYYIEVLASRMQIAGGAFGERRLITKEIHLCQECWEKTPCYGCVAREDSKG